MQILYVILAALAPVVVLLFYIFIKDRQQPEPAKWLIKGFFYGIVSALVVLLTFDLLGVFGIHNIENYEGNILLAFAAAFTNAAIPEELAKLLMLWLLLRKNKYYDEQFDGIVYAVCIGMGFAAFENVMYLISGLQSGTWIMTGISRAIFAVPGHFFYAVIMGYYYSKVHFGLSDGILTRAKVLLAPIFAHGIYDGILFSMSVNDTLAIILMIVFLVFFIRLAKKGKYKIRKLAGK